MTLSRLAFNRLSSLGATNVDPWARTVAVLAAWPAGEPARPSLERRLWRSTARGALRETVVVTIDDPLGMLGEDGRQKELAELARPLTEGLPLRKASAAALAAFDAAAFCHAAELAELAPVIPEGRQALPGLFADLTKGLEAGAGALAMSMVVAPAAPTVEDDEEDADATEQAPDLRRVDFRLRLAADSPIPAALRARAEAICAARASRASTWTIFSGRRAAAGLLAMERHGPMLASAPVADPLTVALTLGLDAHRRKRQTVVGRPVTGPLPADGAPLGRVPRPSGRLAPWRAGWDARQHHLLVAGGSGSGKTTALKRLVADDLEQGRGLVLLDPHGDLARELQGVIADHPGALYVDPREDDPRVLDLLHPDPRTACASIQSAMSELWPQEFSGPMFQRQISIGLRLIAHAGFPLTFTALEAYLTHSGVRQRLLSRADGTPLGQEARSTVQALARPSRDDHSMLDWVVSKFTPLVEGPARSLFDRRASVTWEERIARGDACVVTLPTGLLGDAGARLIGRMLVTRVIQALAAQGSLAPAERRPCSVIIDEAHLVAGPALGSLFAQVRKFGGAVTVATQTPSQLGAHRDLVLANAQTLVLGRLPVIEAACFVDRAGEATVRELSTIPRWHMMLVGEGHDPTTVAPVLSPLPLPELSPASAALEARARHLPPEPPQGAKETQLHEVLDEPTPGDEPVTAEAPEKQATAGGSFLDDWLQRRRAAATAQPLEKPAEDNDGVEFECT